MHDLLVVFCAIVGFVIVLVGMNVIFDILDERMQYKQVRELNELVENGHHALDPTVVALVMAELYRRTSMTGEYRESVDHRRLIGLIARTICILVTAKVHNQMRLILVIVEQINRRPNYSARINVTVNNRVELIIQIDNDPQLFYIKFNSSDTLF